MAAAKHPKYYLTVIFLLLIFDTSFAQKLVSISGKILAKESSKPVFAAKVSIGQKTTFSNADGVFFIKDIDLKQYREIKIEHDSYTSFRKNITAGENKNIEIFLSEENPLDEVVVTGTRTEKTLANTPVLTQIIREKEIEQTGALTAFDALESILPGIQFSPDAHGDNMSIQGLDNDYVLVLVDGERLIGETRGNVNFDRIAAANIKRIEVVNGASSVLYGSNAIGGVINIITKEINHPFEGELKSRYTHNGRWHHNINAGFKSKQFSCRINGFRHSSPGYDLTPETPEYFTANPYVDLSGGGKLTYTPISKLRLSAHGNYFLHESTNPPQTLKSTHPKNRNYSGGGAVSYQFNENHRIKISGNTDIYKAFVILEKKENEETKKSDFIYTSLLLSDHYALSDKWEFMSGAEINLEKIYSANLFGENINEKEKIKQSKDINAFVQADWKIIKNLELLGGVRYTYHSAFKSHFAPKLSAMYKIASFKFRGTAALGYKSPSLKELYYNFDHRGMFWIYGNDQLKPENSRFFSLSGEFSKKNFHFSLTARHNLISDKIDMISVINQLTDKMELRHQNISEACLQGFDSRLEARIFSYLKVRLGYSFTDAEDKSTGLKLFGVSRHTGTAALCYQKNDIKTPFIFTLSCRAVSPRLYQARQKDKQSGKEITVREESKAYSIWKLVYSQKIPLYNSISMQFQAGIDNLFDYAELENGAEINPGRTYWLGLSVKF